MSNLGMYQVATTLFKKFGGPVKFFAITGGVVYVLGNLSGLGISAALKKTSEVRDEKVKAAEAEIIHTVNKEGKSNEGLEFKVGDHFRVLNRDGDAALIEKLGDQNNPYFVSAKFLSGISDYKI